MLDLQPHFNKLMQMTKTRKFFISLFRKWWYFFRHTKISIDRCCNWLQFSQLCCDGIWYENKKKALLQLPVACSEDYFQWSQAVLKFTTKNIKLLTNAKNSCRGIKSIPHVDSWDKWRSVRYGLLSHSAGASCDKSPYRTLLHLSHSSIVRYTL